MDPTRSDNPAVRIVAHNTRHSQPDAIDKQRVKLHAQHGSVAVDDVGDLLDDGVDAGELEKAPDQDLYRIAE